MGECVLFDGFGLRVQMVLGVTALLSLVAKRMGEFPQRPWKVWFFDTSKQGLGALASHVFNTSLSMVFMVGGGNACTWYLVHSVLDTTLGVFTNFLLVRALERWGSTRFKSLDQGFYGHPPSWRVWYKQVLVWLLVVFMSKVLVTVVVAVDKAGDSHMEAVADTVLSPFRVNPRVELVLIMLVVPFVLTVVMFWVQDGFLKKSAHTGVTATWISYSSLESALSRTSHREEDVSE